MSNKSDRMSHKIVARFVSGDKALLVKEGADYTKAARQLYFDNGQKGNVPMMATLLEKSYRGKQAFWYEEGGKIFLESKAAQRLRRGLPKHTPKTSYASINPMAMAA